MWLHRLSGSILLFTTLLYGIVGLVKLGTVVDDTHAYLGITVTAVILFLALSGVIARSRLNRATENQTLMLSFKVVHKVGSLSTIFTS